MATTPVEFQAPSGMTLTVKLYPYGSDSIANGAGGDSATEATNRKGLYSASVAESITGWHTVHIFDASSNLIALYAVYMLDTTDIRRAEEAPARMYEEFAEWISGPNGEGAYTGTLTIDNGAGTPLEGAIVNARRGGVLKASATTNASGQITNWVFGPYTYDLAVRLSGYLPTTDTIAVTADAWVKTISLTAITITAPSDPSLCTVQFRVYLGATAVSGAVCKARLLGINQAIDGTVLSNDEISATTNATGVAELELVQEGEIAKGSGLYKITVEIDGSPVADAKVPIPNQSSILFEDLIK
jgi:hypothetical protein